MLQPVQILISVGGVSLVLLLVWLATRRAAAVVLGGEAGARALIERELLGFRVGNVAVDVGDRRAVATSSDGCALAVVYVMGDRPVCWLLPEGRLELKSEGEGRVAVDVATGDFTRRRFSLTLADSIDDARARLKEAAA